MTQSQLDRGANTLLVIFSAPIVAFILAAVAILLTGGLR